LEFDSAFYELRFHAAKVSYPVRLGAHIRMAPSDYVLRIFGHILTWMFLVGMAGALMVIAPTAYQLFKVLFEEDHPDEKRGIPI
jgi:hypothetical protein